MIEQWVPGARRRAVLAVLLLFVGAARAHAQPALPEPYANRAQFAELVARLRHVGTPNGIETLEQLQLGGTPQWVSIRGRDRSNPILLVVHGGPGTPMLPLAWAYQNGWEDYFTVVQWEQRGAGKNHAQDSNALAATLTVGRIADDGIELIRTVATRLGQRKVVVLGFSAGSVYGPVIAERCPECVSVYVGVGQTVPVEGERVLFRELEKIAAQRGDREALAELAAMAPYPDPVNGPTPAQLATVRKWSQRYGGAWYGHADLGLLYALPNLSPEYTDDDVRRWPLANGWFGLAMVGEFATPGRLPLVTRFGMPVVMLMGRHDLMTPHDAAAEYFRRIRAPTKIFRTFESSAHFVMLEEPGRFLVTLVTDVLPLARAGRR